MAHEDIIEIIKLQPAVLRIGTDMAKEDKHMRILPILFNTDMVRAILDGRKTVTRRLVKPQSRNAYGFYVTFRKSDNAFMGVYDYDEDERQFDNSQTPPAQVGDVLYVRESVFQGVGHYLDVSGETVSVLTHEFEYYADGLHKKDHWKDKHERTWMHRRPSIHMPKEAARIFLKVKDVRVERLQEMKNEDFEKEGVVSKKYGRNGFNGVDLRFIDLRNKFIKLWNSTIKNSDIGTYDWNSNPWVWVIEFEICEKPEKFGKE